MSQKTGSSIERFPTGIAGLDTVLRGGFLKSGVYIIQGAPGTGKTILGNQLCFTHVRNGGRAVYVTLLAETHARMLLHLSGMKFCNLDYIPDSLYYLSAFRVLEEEGLKALIDLIRREIRTFKASMLVLDGLVAAQESAESDRELKKFIHELQVQAGMMDCTIFLLTNGSGKPAHPEHTMVDGLLELSDHHREGRVERELIVRKFRGSSSLLGRHTFRITEEGVVLYPRIEALLATPGADRDTEHLERASTGVAELDEMLRGGLVRGTTTMVLGPSGVGKTSLGLHFLARSTRSDPGLLFGFYESPHRAVHKGDALGLDLKNLVVGGAVEMLWQPPTENYLDALGARLLEAVRRRPVKRLFIDGFGGFQDTSFYPERVPRFFAALAGELRALDVTTVYSAETSKLFGTEIETAAKVRVSPVVENMILLRYVEVRSQLYRLLSIIKVRDSNYDPMIREFTISDGGIALSKTFESAEAILSDRRSKASNEIRPKKRKRAQRARRK